jgi:uncharacterized integral membrane protein
MQKAKLLAIAALALIAIAFVIQNSDPVTAHFLFFTVSAAQAVMLLTTLTIGFLLGILVTMVLRGKRSSS